MTPVRIAFSAPRSESGMQSLPIAARGGHAVHPVSDLTSTARVQPIAYANRQPAAAPPGALSLAMLSPRMKLAAAAGLVLFIALLTVAIVSGSSRWFPLTETETI